MHTLKAERCNCVCDFQQERERKVRRRRRRREEKKRSIKCLLQPKETVIKYTWTSAEKRMKRKKRIKRASENEMERGKKKQALHQWSGYCETFDRHILNLLCTRTQMKKTTIITTQRRSKCMQASVSMRYTMQRLNEQFQIQIENRLILWVCEWVSERARETRTASAIATRCFIKNTVCVYTYIYIFFKRNAWWKKTRIGMLCVPVHAVCCCIREKDRARKRGNKKWHLTEK